MLLRVLLLCMAGSAFFALSWVHAEQVDAGMSAFNSGDYQKALTIWTESAERGDASAQINLGAMYLRGLGVGKNRSEALKWFEKAVEQGSAEAMYNLGQLYETQYGAVQADHPLSYKWYRRAAEQGHPAAQYALGVKYFKGQGVSTDYVSAYVWMDVATRRGYEAARNYRDLIGDVLASDDLIKAKESAEALLTRFETR